MQNKHELELSTVLESLRVARRDLNIATREFTEVLLSHDDEGKAQKLSELRAIIMLLTVQVQNIEMWLAGGGWDR